MGNIISHDNLISNGSSWSRNTIFKQGCFGNIWSSLSWGMSEADFHGWDTGHHLLSFFPQPHLKLREAKNEVFRDKVLGLKTGSWDEVLKWRGIECKLRGKQCGSGVTCFLFHYTAINMFHLILSYFLSLNPIPSQLRMCWSWISLSLLNSFFLNQHFVVEQMNPRCEKNSSHSQRVKSWLIKRKIMFLPGSKCQNSIS